VGFVEISEEVRNVYKILVGKYEGKNYFGNLSVDGRIILT
jgi:hypothetical protein